MSKNSKILQLKKFDFFGKKMLYFLLWPLRGDFKLHKKSLDPQKRKYLFLQNMKFLNLFLIGYFCLSGSAESETLNKCIPVLIFIGIILSLFKLTVPVVPTILNL
jgi:hypothetical protein